MALRDKEGMGGGGGGSIRVEGSFIPNIIGTLRKAENQHPCTQDRKISIHTVRPE